MAAIIICYDSIELYVSYTFVNNKVGFLNSIFSLCEVGNYPKFAGFVRDVDTYQLN